MSVSKKHFQPEVDPPALLISHMWDGPLWPGFDVDPVAVCKQCRIDACGHLSEGPFQGIQAGFDKRVRFFRIREEPMCYNPI